jgi:hypothetical protein
MTIHDEFDFSRWPPVVYLNGQPRLIMIVEGRVYSSRRAFRELDVPTLVELRTTPGEPEYWH